MSFGLNVALLEATHCCPGRETQDEAKFNLLIACAFNTLVSLVDVFDVPFENQQIGCVFPFHLQRAAIGAPPAPGERACYADQQAATREALGAADFDAETEAGT